MMMLSVGYLRTNGGLQIVICIHGIHLFIAIDYLDYLDHQPYFFESYLMSLVMVRPHRGEDCSLAVPEA